MAEHVPKIINSKLLRLIKALVLFAVCISVLSYGATLTSTATAVMISITAVLIVEVAFSVPTKEHRIAFPILLPIVGLSIAALSLIVPALGQQVISNASVPASSVIRAAIWIPTSLLVPGVFVLSMMQLGKTIRRSEMFALAVPLSVAFLGLSTAALRALIPNMLGLVPISILLMGAHILFTKLHKTRVVEFHFTTEGILVVLILLSVLTASATIQVMQGYLVGGDLWRNVKISAYLITRNDTLSLFENPQVIGFYPTFIGYFISAMSEVSGLPVVNAYAAFFVVIGINAIILYCIFDRLANNKKVALLGSFFASLGGGFGWMIAVSQGLMPEIWKFFTASYNSQDMYFSQNILANLLQSTTAVGTFLALSGLLAMLISIKSHDNRTALSLSLISGLLLASSYLTHMVESLFVAILLVILAVFSRRTRELSLSFLSFATCVIFFGSLNGFYEVRYGIFRLFTFMPLTKIIFSTVGITVTGVAFSACVVALLWMKMKHKSFGIRLSHLTIRSNSQIPFRRVYSLTCLLLWLLLIVLWTSSELPQNAYAIGVGYPIWIYPLAFGFIGLLGIIGLRRLSFRDSTTWFILGWMSAVSIAGTFWWGHKSAAFLFIILSFLASLEILSWLKNDRPSTSRVTKIFHAMNRKVIVSTVVLLILLSSSVSFAFTARYFSGQPIVNDDLAILIRWVFEKTPLNVSILCTPPYNEFVANLALRATFPRVEPSDEIEASTLDYRKLIQSSSSLEVASILSKWDIKYALVDKRQVEVWGIQSYFRHLLSISRVLVNSDTAQLVEFLP